MVSVQARQFWQMLKNGTRLVDMPIDLRREVGERAEGITADPVGVTFTRAADVGGLWVAPKASTPRATVLYLFGGGYMLGSPASRQKTAGHIAAAAGARVARQA